ncbi:molybdenum ABC transporter ATP-binding protein [Azonexus fungiphilus]|uniref:molybdenum ABC transporter ATP-binding protein n=1 Tax=Azonexus fungiphilus TaxID=146940 RepID=UPI00156BC031|nr:molybdenum ABC transporter ATP-binding protein [Azonexus fungiphilus]NHC05394.1 molybdenum ABC transporter ATP-binding protein [Azonexus fungiphilus]
MSTIDARFKLDWPGFSLDVDLTLPGRGVSALFGHSGSGKTTLLRCLAGLERAAHGRLCFKGEIWQDEHHWLPTHRRPLGYVFQEASLFPHLSVLGNLDFGRKRASTVNRIALEQAIELLGIGHLLQRKPDGLSGGERQRVAIARALAAGPQILLMDEPLAALDLKRKQEILPYLERLHDQLETPVIYVSHAPDEVARLADHIVALDGGRVVAAGPLAETLARIDLPIRLGEDVGVVLDASVDEIDADWQLMRVAFAGGSLWTRQRDLPPGRRVRVRVLARDVSLAIDEPGRSSIQNVLPARVEAIAADEHPGLLLVRVTVGASRLVARVTRRSADQLGIAPGSAVHVQVKSVALME